MNFFCDSQAVSAIALSLGLGLRQLFPHRSIIVVVCVCGWCVVEEVVGVGVTCGGSEDQ